MPPKTAKIEHKAPAKKTAATKTAAAPKAAASRYLEAKGGRKTAVSRVRLYTKGHTGITVNGKDFKDYFREGDLQETVLRPLVTMGMEKELGVTAIVKGGGSRGQADAISLGIARALTLLDVEFRKRLRAENLLTRDSRAVERKKYGLKKARRAPQWAKR